ncbi:MAG TPA: L,D-transpeptidase family protein [Longimicrobiaceae bacterium]|nr:L,D-transpeptidase family protein [Longimicrobiaceae bacterium]
MAKPKPGKIKISVRGGQATRKLRYVARGGVVRIRGRVKPFVAGQTAVLEVSRRGKVVSRQRARIGRGGRVSFRLRTRRRGVLRLVVRHAATAQQAAFASRSVRLKSVVLRAGQGSRGTRVVLLQRGLKRLGFAVPVSGSYDAGTSRAVLAFRKTNGMARNGFASARIYSLVLRGRGAFRLRFPRAGKHVEFDWSRQVLVLADKGRPRRVYHSSSGTAATPTVFGSFRFYRKDFGTNALGMVHSNYFIRGYAIHGYHTVPNYPASHGCLRVPIPNALDIFRSIAMGERIFVYR